MQLPSVDSMLVEVTAKRVTARRSDDGRFIVLNYAPSVEYDGLWNDVNVCCRGIVLDAVTMTVCARPFRKFWNVGQHPHVSIDALAAKGAPRSVTEKVDGALGIVFWDAFDNDIRVSTRGSTDSAQACWATRWARDPMSYAPDEQALFRAAVRNGLITFLVEIVCDESRIVVPYAFDGLVGLGGIVIATGDVIAAARVGFPCSWRLARELGSVAVDEMLSRARTLSPNEEGWVLRWDDGTMAKVKGADYIALHRLRFDMTRARMIDALRVGLDPISTMRSGIPDEMFADACALRDALRKEHAGLMRQARACAAAAAQHGSSRRDRALVLQSMRACSDSMLGLAFIALDDIEQSLRCHPGRLAAAAWAAMR